MKGYCGGRGGFETFVSELGLRSNVKSDQLSVSASMLISLSGFQKCAPVSCASQEEAEVLLIYLNGSLFIRGNVARKDLSSIIRVGSET